MASAPMNRRVIASALVGNFVEWYDLAIFAYTAEAIGRTYFSRVDPSLQLLVSFAVFAITYLVRPICGVILGAIGDRFGRKRLLVFTILVMGCATTGIGLLPGYATLGTAAPLCLLFLRMMQGIGASGEFMAAATFVAEHSPRERRGMAIGLIQLGTGLCYPAAFGLAFALIKFGGAEWFGDEGWRVLFLVSAPLTFVSLYIRRNLEETPVFERLKAANALSKAPLRDVLTKHWDIVLACIVFMLPFGTNGAQFLFYMPGRIAQLAPGVGQLIVLAGLILFATLIPVWGLMLDRVSIKTVRVLYVLVGIAISVPVIGLIETGHPLLIAMAYFINAAWHAMSFTIIYLTLIAMVPPAVRFTGTALIDNGAKALIAGTAIFISLLLVHYTGSRLAPGWYAAIISLPAIFAALWLGRREVQDANASSHASPSETALQKGAAATATT